MMPIQISKIFLFLQFFNTFVWSSKGAELSRGHFKHALTRSLDAISRQSPFLNYEWSCYQLPSSLLFDATTLMRKDPGRPLMRQCDLDVAALGSEVGAALPPDSLNWPCSRCCCTWRLKWKLRDPICSSVMTVLFEGRKGSSGAAGIFPRDLLAFLPSPSDRCVNSIISKEPWINNRLWARANLKQWRNASLLFSPLQTHTVKHPKMHQTVTLKRAPLFHASNKWRSEPWLVGFLSKTQRGQWGELNAIVRCLPLEPNY